MAELQAIAMVHSAIACDKHALLLIGDPNELHQALAGNLPVNFADVHDNINANNAWSLRVCATI